MKYVPEESYVVFSEIPDQISLYVEISNCPAPHCPGCHSKHLWEDIGSVLNRESLFKLIDANEGITCVLFGGGDAAPNTINWLATCVKEQYPDLKVAWYSGRQQLAEEIDLRNFDYIKLGPYIEELGPLTSKTTNQRLYEYNPYYSDFTLDKCWRDITYKFWK